MRLHIARHGETQWNAEKKVQGQSDHCALTGKGEAQALLLATLVDGRIDQIWSSDLRRARQTAEIVGARLGVERFVDPRLRECCFGTLEGMDSDAFNRFIGRKNSRHAADRLAYDFTPWGGETAAQVLSRMQAFLADLRACAGGMRPLVISHIRTISTFLAGEGMLHVEVPVQGSYIVFDF